jgi:putative exosortase-associated protein (TIGR04073 family)
MYCLRYCWLNSQSFMRKSLSLLGALALVATLGVGCAGPESKLGRGFSNLAEIVRGNEFQRSVEQGGIFEGTDTGFTTGMVRGFNRTMARTGLGVYEIVTAPLPPYHPVWTSYLSPRPLYPDSFRPEILADSIYDTDNSFGFSGGDVAPWFPGSRFRIFDN